MMLSVTLKIKGGTKMKCWSIWEHLAFQRMLLSMLLRLFKKGQEYHEPDVWQKYVQNSSAFVILGHQEIHYKYDPDTFERKIETESTLWKAGKQVFGSVQRECSWLVQCQQIHQQRWISPYQRLGVISSQKFPFFSLQSFWYLFFQDMFLI